MIDKNLKVLLIDPCFDQNGVSNPAIPLSIGLIGSYLMTQLPQVEVKIMKLASGIIKYIENEKPDVVGITNYLWNTNLGIRISRFAREKIPNILLVFGGPEITPNTLDKKAFGKKYLHADLLVEHEGEIAFSKIVKSYLDVDKDRKKLRDHIEDLGNCFYIDSYGKFVKGPDLPRIKGLDNIPSPYSTGMFDEFLADNRFQPLIQTNRGCPYSCTFCHEGSSYFSKIDYHSSNYIKQELNYIADRVDPSVGLQIVDSNFGMYQEDIQTARYLRHLQENKNWPMSIESNTGKSQLPRIMEVAELLNGALMINNSTQSMNDNVLKIIKRKNLKNLMEYVKTIKVVQQPEFILPLPGETKDSFITGLNKMLDTGSLIRLQVHPTLLLNNTEMYNQETVTDYNLKTFYRQHSNLMGNLAGEFVCETERIVVSTSSMSEEEVQNCRAYSLLLDTLLRAQPILEIFRYLDSKGIKKSVFMLKILDVVEQFTEIRECLENYKKALVDENFETEEEVIQYMEKQADYYISGEKGGNNLKYSMQLWIEHFDVMMDLVFTTLKSLFSQKGQNIDKEIQALGNYLNYLYYDRTEKNDSKIEIVDYDFEYDLLSWSQSENIQCLNDFKVPTRFTFQKTSVSDISNLKVWQSFGFFRPKDYKGLPGNATRLYLSRLRRTVEMSKGSTSFL